MVPGRIRGERSRVMKKILLLSLAAALVAGCAVSDPPIASADIRPAAVCSGCGTTWVMATSSAGKPGMHMMARKYRHNNCPLCAQMAAKFMSTHRIQGSCPNCGMALRPCMFDLRGSGTKQSS